MRWYWFDKFTEFERGRSATAVKNISLAEEQLHDHFRGTPIMPNSLVLEGLAQVGGLLASEYYAFDNRVVLAKVSLAQFFFQVRPGDSLVYHVNIKGMEKDGAFVSGTSHLGDRLQAKVEMFFAMLGEETGIQELFQPHQFLLWMRKVRLYEVGRQADGSPLVMPPRLAKANARAIADLPAIEYTP